MTVGLNSVTQRFGATLALEDVSFSATAGAIHAIVGENGAGKTTLMRVLFGAVTPDRGAITLDGVPVSFRSTREAIAAGIGMVSQHYSIIPELSCLQNLMLGAETAWALPLRESQQRAEALAAKMGYEFAWDAEASTLGPAGCQKLEILKLLWRKSKVMILDEPTAMLSPQDADGLYSSLRGLAEEGRTVIVVTHRLPEVLESCKSVTVLRGGRVIEARPVEGLTGSELARAIVGEDISAALNTVREPGPALFEAKSIIVKGYRGDHAVDGASFVLHDGEVVGLAGVDGNGQRELFGAIAGLLPYEGESTWLGTPWRHLDAAGKISAGMRIIPEDRHAEGMVDDWSLVDNAMLGLHRTPRIRRGAWIDRTAARQFAEVVAKRFSTKHSGVTSPARSLSGGNQQRFVAGRALVSEPKLLLAFQPTRGLDLRGTREVYDSIRDVTTNGATALVASFDLDELIENCDRILVIARGRIHEPPAGFARDRLAIGRLMTEAA